MDFEPPSSAPDRGASPVEVVEVAGGRLYRLPLRRIGPLRWFALGPVLLAVGGFVFVVLLHSEHAAKGPLDAITWAFFVLLSLGWARASYTLVSYAAAIWCGRTEVEVNDDGAVRAIDRAGILRVRWGKLKPGAARQVILTELTPPQAGGKSAPPISDLWLLSILTDRGKKVWLAPAHPRDVLASLADILAKQLALTAIQPAADDASEANTSTSPPVVAGPLPVIVEEREIPSRDVLEQPPDSRVRLERHPDGVTMTIPPLGVWRAVGGLIIMGLIFTTVGGIVTAGILGAVLRGNPGVPIPAIAIGLVFFCAGVGVTVGSVHAGRKKVVLAVVGNQFLTFETGPLGSRRREFTGCDLLDIACGPSNVSVNNKPLPQLQIVPAEGKPVGMLTGRDEAELKWIATVLRQPLGISGVPPEYRKPDAKAWDRPDAQ